MSKQKTLFDTVESEKEIKKQIKAEVQQISGRKKDLEAQKKQIFSELHRKQDAIIKGIFLEMPDRKAALFEIAKHSRFSHYKSNLSDEENMKNSIFRAAFRTTVKKEFSSRFEALDKYYEPKIKSIKTALNLL